MLYKICDSDSIRNNGMKVFQLKHNSKSIDVLVGKVNGKLFACDNYCPHRGASLSKSDLSPSNNRIICYLHDFEYDLGTGKLETIPAKWSNQSSEWKKSADLLIYKIVEGDNQIYIDIP
ncbi:MAG TPA: Rieske (2Fe-2S) protein [Nitrososphaeraceae archaeon]|nr:Rieske (2Fe-2S) protein [Nitrososphaeraceae archaeon]